MIAVPLKTFASWRSRASQAQHAPKRKIEPTPCRTSLFPEILLALRFRRKSGLVRAPNPVRKLQSSGLGSRETPNGSSGKLLAQAPLCQSHH